jgi:aspartate aminotransferase-like enzyme
MTPNALNMHTRYIVNQTLLTHSLPDFSRRHHLHTFSQNLKCGWEILGRKVVRINHLDNVSSNIFQNILSVLADVTAKIPKWQRWG